MQGVYALEGDVLRLCLNEAKDGRATQFKSEADRPHKLLLVLERSRD